MNPKPIQTTTYDHLKVEIYQTNELMGLAAAFMAKEVIRRALTEKPEANIIIATGNSQLTFLHSLSELDGIEWSKVNVFHMDEYLGIDPNHRASFPLFLREHIIDYVKPKRFFPVPGQEKDVQKACKEYEDLLRSYPADMVALGIGENGHIAFNDPPYADFDDPDWVKVVKLDEVSRLQQVREKHFQSIDQVPTHAITLTIPTLMAAKVMLCIVPELRKAEAVRACLTDPISEERPGSILRRADYCRLFLDVDSASRL